MALQRGGGACSPGDFSVWRAGSSSAALMPDGCRAAVAALRLGRAATAVPLLLVRSACGQDATVTLQAGAQAERRLLLATARSAAATHSHRRAMRDSVFSVGQGVARTPEPTPAPSEGPRDRRGRPSGNGGLLVRSDKCSGPNCKVFVLSMVALGIVCATIVAVPVVTRCGPCKFCIHAWRHRNDPLDVRPVVMHGPSRGDRIKAAEMVAQVVTPHQACAKTAECPVCLACEGDWSTLPCGHHMCNVCLEGLVKAQAMLTNCPLCRTALLPDAPEHTACSDGGPSARTSVTSRSSLTTLSTLSALSASSAAGPSAADVFSNGEGDSRGASGGSNAGGSGEGCGGCSVPVATPSISAVQLTSIPEMRGGERGSVDAVAGAVLAPPLQQQQAAAPAGGA